MQRMVTTSQPNAQPSPALLRAWAHAAREGDTIALARLRAAVADALAVTDGDRTRAAKRLRIARTTLHYWLAPKGSDDRALGLTDVAAAFPGVPGPHKAA